MANWSRIIRQIGIGAEGGIEQLKQRLHRRLQHAEPVVITPYRGFGTKEQLYLKGRVLKDNGIVAAQEDDTLWDNLHAMYLRFASHEVAGVRVQAQFQGESWEEVTDEEGYFDFALNLTHTPAVNQQWHTIQLTLPDRMAVGPSSSPGTPVTAVGKVLTPTIMSTFGIISDIDDTIVATQATHLLKMARVVFLNNARTRLPFAGVAAFYRALQAGRSGSEANPIFYVSSSPWNLYDLLVDFLAIHKIPAGPVFLQDYGLAPDKFITAGHHAHKLAAFKRILLTYPMLPFILIGDSGQEDPEIYTQVVRDYPGRIRAIYIRDVSADIRDSAVQKLIAEADKHAVEMLLVPDTVAAANHAVQRGFIHADALPAIVQEKREDVAAPNDMELLVEEKITPQE
jgi:phosphatidate phosphatase APP1